MRTTTDTITVHTASAVHGTGAGITVHTGALGVTVRGDITDTTTHGTMEGSTIRGDMPDIGADTMTHGTMGDTGEECTEDTGDGMTHGTTTITTVDGMTLTITITVLHI